MSDLLKGLILDFTQKLLKIIIQMIPASRLIIMTNKNLQNFLSLVIDESTAELVTFFLRIFKVAH